MIKTKAINAFKKLIIAIAAIFIIWTLGDGIADRVELTDEARLEVDLLELQINKLQLQIDGLRDK